MINNKKIISVTTAGVFASSMIVSHATISNAATTVVAYNDPIADWPNQFIPYTQKDGTVILDPANEPGISPDDVDFTSGYEKGIGDQPTFYIASDGDTLFFRVRLLGDPHDRKGGFLSSVWLVDIGMNGVHKATVGVDGKSPHEDYIYVSNATGTKIKYINKTDGTGSQVPGTRIVDAENGHYFLDFQVPIHRITEVAPEITASSAVQFFFGTSKAANLSVINKDYTGTQPGVSFERAAGVRLSGSSLTYIPTITFANSSFAVNYESQTPAISGTTTNAQNGSTVILELVSNNSGKITYTTTVNNGTWSITPTSPLAIGTYAATATVTNEIGNTAQAKQEIGVGKIISIDGPSILKVKTFPATITGTFTNNTGAAKKVDVKVVNSSNSEIGKASRVNVNNSKWTTGITWNNIPPSNGTYTITAVENGQTAPTASQTIIIDNQIQVTIDSPTDGTRSSIATPTLTGTTDPHAKVELFIDGSKFREVTADGTGAWSCYVGTPLSPGSHQFNATATDEFGNTASSSAVSYNVNTINISIANGSEVTINDNQPTIRGRSTAQNGSEVIIEIRDQNTHFSIQTTVLNGKWGVTVPVEHALQEGTYDLTARVTDKTDAGLTASATQRIRVDFGTFVTISSPANNMMTTNRRELISGTSEPNATIDINIDNGEMVYTAFADGSGNWQYTPDTDLSYGPHSVVATTSDIVGNTAITTTSFAVNSIGNNVPIVQDVQVTTALNTAVSGTVEASDPDQGDILSYAIGLNPTNGTVSMDSEGNWIYTPYNDYSGSDSFTIQVSDGKGGAFSTVSILVNAVNQAPSAVAPIITGTAQVGQVLTGSHTYSDADGDEEGNSIYQWYRGSSVDGSDKAAVQGATSKTYLLTEADKDHYLFFSVIPVASSGATPGAPAVSPASGLVSAVPVVNQAPTASEVMIGGTAQVGETLTGSYTYSDSDGDAEGESIFQWYRGSSVNGSDKAAVQGATSKTYLLTEADKDHYLFFSVIPVASSGATPGAPAVSPASSLVSAAPVVNQAPTASEVMIGGTAQVGQELMGSYVYYDVDNDEEGSSIYKWYRGSSADGSDKEVIESVVSATYTPTTDDLDMYFFFGVTPVASTGTSLGIEVISAARGPVSATPVVNQAPTASGVRIRGTAQVGQQLAGDYDYFDVDEDAESNSLYQWYRGSSADGLNKVAIEGATSESYTLTAEDEGQYLFFAVIPVAGSGTTPGVQAVSPASGLVLAAPVENQAPTASGVSISGKAQVGQTLTGDYTYSDADNDGEGTSTYRWYRGSSADGSDKAAIPNATAITYTVTADDLGKYLFLGVTPTAITGVISGTEVYSASTVAVRAANQAPTATPSITGTAVVGQVLTGSHTYRDADGDAEGNSTYQWYRGSKADGSDKQLIANATTRSYTLTTEDLGKYLFFAVIPEASSGATPGAEVVSSASGQVTASTTWVAITQPASGKVLTDARPNMEGTGEIGNTVTLFIDGNLAGTTTINSDGKWMYSLTEDLANGPHTVNVVSTNMLGLTARATTAFTVNKQAAQVQLDLVTDPIAIVGDGRSTSRIIATVKDTEGNLLPNVPVEFSAEAGTLSKLTGTTGPDGKVEVTLTSPLLESILPVQKLVTVKVNDPVHHLAGEESIVISFMPAAIEGVVIGQTGMPVSGARVELKEDFNRDGIIDFETSAFTDTSGKYRITVPRGNHVYTPIITVPVEVNNKIVGDYTFSQTAQVGQLSGLGGTIISDKTVKGQLFVTNEAGQIIEAKKAQNGFTLEGAVFNDPSIIVDINPDGSFEIKGVEKGKSYDVLVTPVAPDGTQLAGKIITIDAIGEGQMTVAAGLIDPYGVVIDSVTKVPISGVQMRLHWAKDGAGHRAGDLVDLPSLPNFPPADNADPQVTNSLGEYAWMVFPDSDYYITASKAGYHDYDSRLEGRDVSAKPNEDSYITDGVIHVGQSIVAYSFSMDPINNNNSRGSSKNRETSSSTVAVPVPQAPAMKHQPYMVGFKDGMFKPERAVTRAEVAGMLARLLRSTKPNFSPPPFIDVDPEHWAAQHIELVRREGIMIGDSRDRFNPNHPITRAEMASVITRFKKLSLQEPSSYKDAASHWAVLQIGAVEAAGYMVGFPDKKFRPNQKLTRAEAVTVINRVLERGPLNEYDQQFWPDVPKSHWAYQDIMEASISHSSHRDEKGNENFELKLEDQTW